MAFSTNFFSFVLLLLPVFSLKTQARTVTESNFFKAALANELKQGDDQIPYPLEEDRSAFSTQQSENVNGLSGNANTNFFKAARNIVANDQIPDPLEEDHSPFPTQQSEDINGLSEITNSGADELKAFKDDRIPDPFEEDHLPFPTQQSENFNGLYGNTYYQEVQDATNYPTDVGFNGGSHANTDSTDTKDAVYRPAATSHTAFGGFNEDSYKKYDDFVNSFDSMEQYRNEQETFVP